jgi:hypothetical protein
MVTKMGMLFVLVVVVLMFGRSVNGHRQMIRSTKPNPPVKKGIVRAVIAPTAPVKFKSISMSEQRPSIQVLKQHKRGGRVLTLSFYEYKVLSPRGWFGPQHPLDCVDTLYEEGLKYDSAVDHLLRLKKCISWMNNRGVHLYF